MPLLALAHQPRQRPGAPCVDHMDHQRDPPAPDDTASADQPQRLQGQLRQQDRRRGEKGAVLGDGVVVHPSGPALHATPGRGAIGHVRRDCGPLGALAGPDAADEGGQGGQVAGQPTCWLAWVPLCQGLPYGTILAEVGTHCLLLLDGSRFSERVYDETTS